MFQWNHPTGRPFLLPDIEVGIAAIQLRLPETKLSDLLYYLYR